MSKQTAVEWLVKEIEEKHNFRFGNFYWAEITQAKAIEKEQIVDAHLLGLIHSLEKEATQQASEYYDATYGKEAGHE